MCICKSDTEYIGLVHECVVLDFLTDHGKLLLVSSPIKLKGTTRFSYLALQRESRQMRPEKL